MIPSVRLKYSTAVTNPNGSHRLDDGNLVDGPLGPIDTVALDDDLVGVRSGGYLFVCRELPAPLFRSELLVGARPVEFDRFEVGVREFDSDCFE